MTIQNEPNHCFVVEDDRGTSFELQILPADDRAYRHFQSVWQRLSLAFESFNQLENLVVPNWVYWQLWKWYESKQRQEYKPRQMFVAWCGSHQVGILNVWAGFNSVHEQAKSTLYIEHIGASPGSLNTKLWNRRYRKIGPSLLAYAVFLSKLLGTEGRLSLHTSDDYALEFYQKFDTTLGGGLFYPELKNILGPTPQANRGDRNRSFLETKLDGALRLLEDYRND